MALHQGGYLAAHGIQERHAHVGVCLDLVHEDLHIGSGQSMAADAGINLSAKGLQKTDLISVERLGTGMGDVHRRNRGDQLDVAESPSRSSKVSDVEIMSLMLSSLS